MLRSAMAKQLPFEEQALLPSHLDGPTAPQAAR